MPAFLVLHSMSDVRPVPDYGLLPNLEGADVCIPVDVVQLAACTI